MELDTGTEYRFADWPVDTVPMVAAVETQLNL